MTIFFFVVNLHEDSEGKGEVVHVHTVACHEGVWWVTTLMTEVLYDFPRFLQANARTVSQAMTTSFQILCNQSFHHPVQYRLDTESVLK